MASGAVPKDKSVEKVIWLEDIYNYLYTQKSDIDPPKIHIPSTVMLKYQRPCAWFTSSAEGELIKRYDTKDLDPHVIKKQFCEGSGTGTKKHDCVAYYVSYAKGQKGQRTAKIEYFDDKGLENFFLNRPKENNGIVQKFEDPTSPYNTVLRAYWTPHKLQLQQRVNKYEIGDLRVVMNDRLSTFDGPEYLNVEFEIKSYKLKLRLTETVNSIVEHIQMLLPSAYTLWTMECFFKLSGKNKLLFLWCNDLRVFNTNEPPKIEAFLTPPVNAHVAPKHKYEKKELKREYFKCPCSGSGIDENCDKVGGLFHVSQMKIVSYRYMILFFQSQAPVEKDVSIPADDVLCKLSPYKQRWIEEDAMIKFLENSTVKAYQLSCGSLVYQKPRPEILRSCGPELEGWQNIPPILVSNADPLVFKFLSKLAIVDGKVVQAHKLTEYSRDDLADFRRFFTNIVQMDKGPDPQPKEQGEKNPKGGFLDRKMKVCDACCTRFYAAADDSMSLEMTKLVVGAPDADNTSHDSTAKRSKSRLGNSTMRKSLQLESSQQVIKTNFSVDQYLPSVKGAGTRERSHTALGLAGVGKASGKKSPENEASRAASADPAGRPGGIRAYGTQDESGLSGGLSRDDMQSTSKSSLNKSKSSNASTRNVRIHPKNVSEWIRFFYEEADLKNASSSLSKSRNVTSPYVLPIPFKE